MKTKISLLNKIKIMYYFIFNKSNKDITMVKCNYCGSGQIKFKEGKYIDKNTYTSNYYCKKCGATCVNIEAWKKGKEE